MLRRFLRRLCASSLGLCVLVLSFAEAQPVITDVTGFSSQGSLKNFLAQTDLRVYMNVADDTNAESGTKSKQPIRLGVGFEPGCYWLSNDLLRIYVPVTRSR